MQRVSGMEFRYSRLSHWVTQTDSYPVSEGL
jgi:hypothetical protein